MRYVLAFFVFAFAVSFFAVDSQSASAGQQVVLADGTGCGLFCRTPVRNLAAGAGAVVKRVGVVAEKAVAVPAKGVRRVVCNRRCAWRCRRAARFGG